MGCAGVWANPPETKLPKGPQKRSLPRRHRRAHTAPLRAGRTSLEQGDEGEEESQNGPALILPCSRKAPWI